MLGCSDIMKIIKQVYLYVTCEKKESEELRNVRRS